MVASDPVIIPYKVLNIRVIPIYNIYGIITGSLPAYFSRASYNPCPVFQVKQYLAALPEDKRPVNTVGVQWRIKQLQTQLPR